ncbi:MAG: hypothetical protein ACMVO5_06635 [Polymorphobacter sp.]|uniref:hypothetical protein n=1 Tax=Polymorphobacter sp. TaxID=1909290 RepID=UPI003A85A846
MSAIAVVALLFSGTAMLGGWLAFQFWTGGKAFKGASAVHLLIGAAALEGLVLLLRGAPDGTRAPVGDLGPYAAFGLAMAFVTGLCIPLIAKPKPGAATSAIIAHASVATLGLGALLIWLIRA